MKQKNCSFFCLLMSTMLLFSFSSIFAAVTVTYQPASFPYNTVGNVITAKVQTTEAIAAFDLLSKVRSSVNNAYGQITAVNVSAVAGAAVNVTKVNGITDDTTRIYGFACGTPIIMPIGIYNFTFTVTTTCDTGEFVMEDGGTWVVDPDPVDATTMFVNTSAAAANLTVIPGTYRVINRPPSIVDCPTQALTFNACTVLNHTFTATDPDNSCKPTPDFRWYMVSGPGSIGEASGIYQWDPDPVAGICGLYEVEVQVMDEFGATANCHFQVNPVTDAPHFTECPTPSSDLWDVWGTTFTGGVTAVDPDNCPLALAYSLVSFSGPITAGPFQVISATGAWSWPTLTNDPAYVGIHTVVISVTDGCESATCTFQIEVVGLTVVIKKVHDVYQGHYVNVPVQVFGHGQNLGGFDFLIAYDASALILQSVAPGDSLDGWEYFTYRFGGNGNCNGPCPSGFVRIVAMADMNNGANHPTLDQFFLNGDVAYIRFLVTNDRTFDCMFLPVSFYWQDCGDNILSDKSGVNAFLSRFVWMFGPTDSTRLDILHQDGYGGWHGIEGAPDCEAGMKIHPHSWVDFYDGGVDIKCADSIDARGDINLNGIANEIADAVLYTNYFLYGITAIPCQPITCREGAIAASDVNADGRTLTVGDLVYLLRVIVGDALPYAKLAPFSSTTDVNVIGGKLSTTSSEALGALHLTFDVTGDYSVVNNSNMEVVSALTDGKLNVLVYSGMSNMRNSIPAGTNELLTITGAELSSVEVSDYYGNLMNTRVEKTALPTRFALQQNIPNPFNPSTKIGLDLPVVSSWKIDIYNVNGQLVQSYNGTNIGHVEVTWDASNVASGIYFYKVAAGSFTETKKMVLMK